MSKFRSVEEAIRKSERAPDQEALGKQYKDLEYNSKNDGKPSEDFEEASEVI